jgi:hypothetical protein
MTRGWHPEPFVLARKEVDNINPTNATRTIAHIAVGIAAAVIVPKLTGKGTGAAAVGALIAVFLHEMLDAPVAKAMASASVRL